MNLRFNRRALFRRCTAVSEVTGLHRSRTFSFKGRRAQRGNLRFHHRTLLRQRYSSFRGSRPPSKATQQFRFGGTPFPASHLLSTLPTYSLLFPFDFPFHFNFDFDFPFDFHFDFHFTFDSVFSRKDAKAAEGMGMGMGKGKGRGRGEV